MNRKFLAIALVLLASLSPAGADQIVESVQQKLKDQGFYYGEITGTKDADTTAAIRRYQIRNGLQITGEIDAQTQRSLGLAAKPSATPRPRPANTPGPTPPKPDPVPPQPPPERDDAEDVPDNAPESRGPRFESGALFDGTPFQAAPPQAQRDVIISAQTILMRQGYYRDGIDGVYGPGMNFALRAFQARFGLTPTGRLDVETLASLGLLPGQRTRRLGPVRRPLFPPRTRIGPTGELIYIPR